MPLLDLQTSVLFRNKHLNSSKNDKGKEWQGGVVHVCNTDVTKKEIKTRLHPDCRASIEAGTTVLYLVKAFEDEDDHNRLIPVMEETDIVELTAESVVRKRVGDTILLDRVMPELLERVIHTDDANEAEAQEQQNQSQDPAASSATATTTSAASSSFATRKSKQLGKLVDLTFKLRNTPALQWMVEHGQSLVPKLKQFLSDDAFDANKEQYGKLVVMGEQISMLSKEGYLDSVFEAWMKLNSEHATQVKTMVGYLYKKAGHHAVIHYKDNLKRTPEHVAALRGDPAMLIYVLAVSSGPNFVGSNVKVLPVDKFGETPFHNLATKGHYHLADLYRFWFQMQISKFGTVRLIPLEDWGLTNRDGQTALDMCTTSRRTKEEDRKRTSQSLLALRKELKKYHSTIYDEKDSEADDSMTPEELTEWVEAQEKEFLRVCLGTTKSTDEDDEEEEEDSSTLQLDEILGRVKKELSKIMRVRLRPTLAKLQKKYYVLGKCFSAKQVPIALIPDDLPFPRHDLEEEKQFVEKSDSVSDSFDIISDSFGILFAFEYDLDFTSIDMYSFHSDPLLNVFVKLGDEAKVIWLLDKSDSEQQWWTALDMACFLGQDDVVYGVLDRYDTKFGKAIHDKILQTAVSSLNSNMVDGLICSYGTKATPNLLELCLQSGNFSSRWTQLGLPTDTAFFHKKLEWKSRRRLPILKSLIGKYQIPEEEVDWQSLLILACDILVGASMVGGNDIPLTEQVVEFLLAKDGTDLLSITDPMSSDQLERAPKWLTENIVPAAEEKRRDKQREAIAIRIQPLIRGRLTWSRVRRDYPDFGCWRNAIIALQRLVKGNEPRKVQFQSWIQLKLANPIVFQSEEFKILEEAALATQGYDDDFNEEDYEKNSIPAFPGMKPSDSAGRVCTILFTSGILNWRRKVKDQKYLGMFRDRIDSLARGGNSYCLSKRLKGSNHGALETKLDKGMRIIWTQRGMERMIWFVCKHDHITKCVELIDKSYDRVVKSRVNYGLQEWEEIGDTDTTAAEPDMLASPEQNTPLKIHSVSVEALASSWNDIEWRPPLKLTAVEEEIVNLPGTVLLLGRSGTGKTLCVCNRMARDRQQYGTELRQMFVARTRRLCEYVKDLQQREQFGTDILQHAKFQTMEELAHELFEQLDADTSEVWKKGTYVDFKRFRDEFAKGDRVKQILPQRKILLMWTQIRSFIKGSYEAVSRGRPLEEAEYLDKDVIEKDRCRLKEKERADAYKVYAFYRAYLKEAGLWDEMDRAAYVARLMVAKRNRDIEEYGEPQALCQRVYVDEVQDITQAEMAILFYAAGGKVDSMFFAGDNAQSVSEGVDFRFAEVRSLVHKITSNQGRIERPHRLERNFRSHERILRVSNFLLERMYVAFPNSVTKLKTDLGLVMGPRPGILAQCSVDQLAEIISENQRLRVLVRDEHRATLESDLEERLGSEASSKVLGIREAKGLEFTEVLIVDFFATIREKSHHKAWKAIIEGNLEGKLDEIPATMELELKLLYTAITRCCDRLFFVETKRTVSFDKWKLHLTTPRPGSNPDSQPEKLAQIMEPEQTKSERGIMTVDDYRVEGIENASLVAGEDMDYEDATKYLERAVVSFAKAGDKMLEEKARMHLKALHKKEAVRSSANTEFGDVLLSFVDAGLVQDARDYCKDYASGGLKRHFQEQLNDLANKAPPAPADSPMRRSTTMERSYSGMSRMSSMESY